MFVEPCHFHGAFEKEWNTKVLYLARWGVRVNKHEELPVGVVGQNAENETAVEEAAVPADNPMAVVVAVAAGQEEVGGLNPAPNSDRDSLDYTYTKHKPDIQLTVPIKQHKNDKTQLSHSAKNPLNKNKHKQQDT